MTDPWLSPSDDTTSTPVDPSTYDPLGFAAPTSFPLRRHRHEPEAIEGSRLARADWLRHIGPIDTFGNCNPYSGHFAALTLPLCAKERLRVIAYVFEYAFLYDQHLESAERAERAAGDWGEDAGLDRVELRRIRDVGGTKQMQSKMLLELLRIDGPCAEVVTEAWKEMVATTARLDKKRGFGSLEDYVDYRIVDTGAPFVDTLMRFGMGMRLTQEEEAEMAPIAKPCYAALGLANDFFSFDEEYAEFQKSDDENGLTNAVWLFMQWHGVDVARAKEMVRETTNGYEREFKRRWEEFCERKPNETKLHDYMRGLGYQISGNVAWSLTCPRYHPEKRYDPNIGTDTPETHISAEIRHIPAGNPASEEDSVCSDTSSVVSSDDSSAHSRQSSISSVSSFSSNAEESSSPSKGPELQLGLDHVMAPFDYITSLPSKGVRDVFIDALNIWLRLPETVVTRVKSIINTLHSASLMLDDIEDSSPLRRGNPAAHMVFGHAQTINSANYQIISALEETAKLPNPQSVSVFTEELKNLHVGQSWDLYWTQNRVCPSEKEYLEMVDKKTGGLFRLTVRLLSVNSADRPALNLGRLTTLLGHFFQIRDDYHNLADADYTSQKGFCEDLDEGKYSFPLIHSLRSDPSNMQLQNLLHQSRRNPDGEGLMKEQKRLVLRHMERTDSLEYTKRRLIELEEQVNREVRAVEERTGVWNWVLRLLVFRLRV